MARSKAVSPEKHSIKLAGLAVSTTVDKSQIEPDVCGIAYKGEAFRMTDRLVIAQCECWATSDILVNHVTTYQATYTVFLEEVDRIASDRAIKQALVTVGKMAIWPRFLDLFGVINAQTWQGGKRLPSIPRNLDAPNVLIHDELEAQDRATSIMVENNSQLDN